MAAAGARLVGDRAKAVGRDSGTVCGVGGVLGGCIEQGGSSLNLFAERSTRHVLLGFDFPPSWFQFVPSLFVMILAPAFAWLWIALGKREPSSPTKFAWGLFFGAIAFAILIPPAQSRDGRRAGFAMVADGNIFSANGGRDVPEPGGIERDDEAGARARGRVDDGLILCFDQHWRLSGGDRGIVVRIDAAAGAVRRGGGISLGARWCWCC